MSDKPTKIPRQSNFELLRLFSMFLIIWYHISMHFLANHNEYAILRSSWFVLHIGVVCFVLISGFFGIKPSVSGFVRFLGVFFVYSLPSIIYGCLHAETFSGICSSCMFITRSDYWFVRTYMALYLLSPLLNKFNASSTLSEKSCMLIVLGLISVGAGNLARYPLYADGTNVINFMFLYQLGHILKNVENTWKDFSAWKVLMVYVLLNVSLISLYVFTSEMYLGRILWRSCFPYNSPFLIINSVIVFMLFGKLNIVSKTINYCAQGVFAVYLIHGNEPYGTKFLKDTIEFLYQYIGCFPLFICASAIASVVILFMCLFINFVLTPLWILLERIGRKMDKYLVPLIEK